MENNLITWENRPNGLFAFLHLKHMDKIEKLCGQYYPNECGGVLLGKYDKSLKKAYIKQIYFTKENVGQPASVVLEARKVNIILQALWKLTFGKYYLLGTWHSHPNGGCFPSSQDDDTMFKIAKSVQCQCTRPILLISVSVRRTHLD